MTKPQRGDGMKKYIIAFAAIVCVTVLILVGFIAYHNRYYDVGVCISYPVDITATDYDAPLMKADRKNGKSYFCAPSFWGGDKLSERQKKNYIEVSDDIRDYIDGTVMKFERPFYIECSYENVGSETVITYRGEVTNPETGELENYEKVFTYPFIVTKSIQPLPYGSTNYFD